MRRHQKVVKSEQRLIGRHRLGIMHIGRCRSQAARLQGSEQRIMIHDGGTRSIDQPCARFDTTQFIGTDQTAGSGLQRHMHTQDVGALEQSLATAVMDTEFGLFCCRQTVTPVILNIQTKSARHRQQFERDLTHAEQTQCHAADYPQAADPAVIIRARVTRVIRAVCVTELLQTFNRDLPRETMQLFGQREDQRHGVFGHRDIGATALSLDHHAACRARRQIDIVGARAEFMNEAQMRREGQLGGTHRHALDHQGRRLRQRRVQRCRGIHQPDVARKHPGHACARGGKPVVLFNVVRHIVIEHGEALGRGRRIQQHLQKTQDFVVFNSDNRHGIYLSTTFNNQLPPASLSGAPHRCK